MITITHTHADGTLISGSRKGDGVYYVLKGLRDNWRYFPSIGQIGLGQSRDRNAQTWKIERAAEALRDVGHEVTVTVDESQRRTFAEAEQERYERAEGRAERYEEYAGNAAGRAASLHARAQQMSDAIPFGQPMMPDHYSYGRDRRYRARMASTYERSFAESDKAEHYEQRAATAESFQAHRENIPTTLRRIAKLEADERRVKRDIAGRMDYVSDGNGGYELQLVKPGPSYLARLESSLADISEQLAYWRQHVAGVEAAGVKIWSAADFTKGDYVQMRREGRWYLVERVNPKSLTVPSGTNLRDLKVVTRANVRHAMGPSQWTDKVPYEEVTDRKTAAEIAELLAEAEQSAS